jgi:hypothetical protein
MHSKRRRQSCRKLQHLAVRRTSCRSVTSGRGMRGGESAIPERTLALRLHQRRLGSGSSTCPATGWGLGCVSRNRIATKTPDEAACFSLRLASRLGVRTGLAWCHGAAACCSRIKERGAEWSCARCRTQPSRLTTCVRNVPPATTYGRPKPDATEERIEADRDQARARCQGREQSPTGPAENRPDGHLDAAGERPTATPACRRRSPRPRASLASEVREAGPCCRSRSACVVTQVVADLPAGWSAPARPATPGRSLPLRTVTGCSAEVRGPSRSGSGSCIRGAVAIDRQPPPGPAATSSSRNSRPVRRSRWSWLLPPVSPPLRGDLSVGDIRAVELDAAQVRSLVAEMAEAGA